MDGSDESIDGGSVQTGVRRFEAPARGALLDSRYELDARVGEGSFGEVWKAADRRLGIPVAIKLAKSGTDRARFEREVRLLAKLQHPGVVTLRDQWDVSDASAMPYFVMDHCGSNLKEWIAARMDTGLEGVEESLSIFFDLCRATAFVHDSGAVHRDLKPSNVLLRDGTGRLVPVLADFGVARDLPSGDSTATRGVGTMLYQSPEQALEEPSGAAADVFALAVLLFEMLTGEPSPEPGRPFWKIVAGVGMASSTGDTKSRVLVALQETLSGTLPDPALQSMACALSYFPADRPSAAELGEGVVRAARGGTKAAERGRRAGERRPWDRMALVIAGSNAVGYLFASGRPVLLDPKLTTRVGWGARTYPHAWLILPLCGCVIAGTLLVFRRVDMRRHWWAASIPLIVAAGATIPILPPEIPHGGLVSDTPVWVAFTSQWLAAHYAFNIPGAPAWWSRSQQTQKRLFILFTGALVSAAAAPIPIMVFIRYTVRNMVTDPGELSLMHGWIYLQIALWSLLWLVGPTRELGVAWFRMARRPP